MSSAWYFAYGSNMQSATFSGRRGIAFHAAIAGRVGGWRLVFDKPPLIPIGESFANIIADRDAEVLGVLYQIDAADLAHLDISEGVPIGNYQRITVRATPLDASAGTARSAFTLASDRRGADLLPSKRYMELVIAGAIEHGLPEEYVAGLRAVSARPDSLRAALLRPLIDRAIRRR